MGGKVSEALLIEPGLLLGANGLPVWREPERLVAGSLKLRDWFCANASASEPPIDLLGTTDERLRECVAEIRR